MAAQRASSRCVVSIVKTKEAHNGGTALGKNTQHFFARLYMQGMMMMLQKCAVILLTTPEQAGNPVDCALLHCEVHT